MRFYRSLRSLQNDSAWCWLVRWQFVVPILKFLTLGWYPPLQTRCNDSGLEDKWWFMRANSGIFVGTGGLVATSVTLEIWKPFRLSFNVLVPLRYLDCPNNTQNLFCIFVGTGVLDCPNNTQNLFCIFLEVYTFADMILYEIFHFVTDRRGRRSLRLHQIQHSLFYRKFPFIFHSSCNFPRTVI